MFDSIRRHQKWLWILISAAVIVSFVIFFTPDAGRGLGGAGGSPDYGTIAGRTISRDEAYAAFNEARLRYRLFSGTGTWPDEDNSGRQFFNQDRETQTRLFIIETLRQMNFQVSEKAVADWVASVFVDPDRRFRSDLYQGFIKNVLQPRGMNAETLLQFARHEIGLQHLIQIAGQTGQLIPPQEVETLFRSQNEQFQSSVVLFAASNHAASVTIDPAGLATFFTNQMARYRIPERVQVSYVQFDTTNFLAEADSLLGQRTNLAQIIDAIYTQRGTNEFRESDGRPMAADAAKALIQSELRLNQALLRARTKATDFADELFELHEKQPNQADQLDQLASAKGLTSKTTEPFDTTGPRGLALPPDFTRAAYRLTPEEPNSPPIVSSNHVYVIALKRRIPSEVPALETIQARVTDDYRQHLATEAARQAGRTFHQNLTNGLAQGKSWDALCAEAGVAPVKLPDFSPATRFLPEIESKVSLALLRSAVTELQANKPSRFVEFRDGGFVAYLHARNPVNEDKLKSDLSAFADELRQERQYEAFNEWLRRQRELAGLRFATDDRDESPDR